MGLLVAAGVAAPGLAWAQPADLYYERTVMTAADARCGLFAPEISAALAAGTAQARGAALRAGASSDALRDVERAARAKASVAGCTSPEIAAAAARVKAAYSGYARVTRLTYAGDVAGWRADRNLSRDARWRLAQETGFGPDRLTFGLAGQGGVDALVAVARFADDAEPYAARLVLRDAARSGEPYLDRWGGGSTAGLPLARRLPPRSALKAFGAQARSPAGAELLPKDARGGWSFRFPEAAAAELARLDPREAVAVEFLFPGDQVRRAYVEVGDFAAGRAFLQVASR
ncbi:MAG: hypothetical protein ACJ798_16580 [Phenylobacterium sp.]